eukprot:COSAG02_NODE_1006_length_15265_cov_58.666886_8_plen_165_part_00
MIDLPYVPVVVRIADSPPNHKFLPHPAACIVVRIVSPKKRHNFLKIVKTARNRNHATTTPPGPPNHLYFAPRRPRTCLASGALVALLAALESPFSAPSKLRKEHRMRLHQNHLQCDPLSSPLYRYMRGAMRTGTSDSLLGISQPVSSLSPSHAPDSGTGSSHAM